MSKPGPQPITWTPLPADLAAPATGLLYLASPYSHPDGAIRYDRYLAVNRALWHLTFHCGLTVYSPIVHFHNISLLHGVGYEANHWQRLNEAFLSLCHGMLVLKLPMWQQSKGIGQELVWCRERGVPIWAVEPKGTDYIVQRMVC